MAGLEDYISVDVDDVETGWRALTDDQVDAVVALLDRAFPILQSQTTGLLDRLEAKTTPPEAVEQVLIQAVRRAATPMFNPDGARRVSRRIDDYSEEVEYDTNALAGGLYFTAGELASLTTQTSGRRGKAFTINTTPKP